VRPQWRTLEPRCAAGSSRQTRIVGSHATGVPTRRTTTSSSLPCSRSHWRGRLLGLYRTRRRASRGTPYATWLGGVAPIEGSCACADFLRSSLGLCKHLVAVLEDVIPKAGGHVPARAPARSPLRWDPGPGGARAAYRPHPPAGAAPADRRLPPGQRAGHRSWLTVASPPPLHRPARSSSRQDAEHELRGSRRVCASAENVAGGTSREEAGRRACGSHLTCVRWINQERLGLRAFRDRADGSTSNPTC
jgi:hypothetical protein